jgi:hypothetical protein
VQLEQVDAVDAEAVERAADLLARAGAVTLTGLRREEKRSRCCASQGASLSSASPYDAAVSMWLMPCSSNSSRVGSASACVREPSDAAPKSVRVLS